MAWLVAAQGAHADPGAPPLAPLRRQREDAQRMREQQRTLEGERGTSAAPAPVPARSTALLVPESNPRRTAGQVLLVVSAASAAASFLLYTSSLDPSDQDSSDTDWAVGLLATSALTGVVGFALVLSGRGVQVAPAVTPNAVGLALTGRL